MRRVTLTAETPDGGASLVQEVVADDADLVDVERRMRRRLRKAVPDGARAQWSLTVDDHAEGSFW